MRIEELDGPRLREAVIVGADHVRASRDQLNRMNVFPVPDGDTGTNLALSLAATAAALRSARSEAVGEIAQVAAEACILNAKGNSGTIMAHWFLGLSRPLHGKTRAGLTDVAAALEHATAEVYGGIEHPVEGTVISVMRAVSERAVAVAGGSELAPLMDSLLDAARDALARTPEQLDVLRSAHVVDAGAQGYVNFLEGMARAMRGEPASQPPLDSAATVAFESALHDHGAAELEERYCTEVVVRGSGFEAEQLRRIFRPFGSSLLVATTGTVFKLHVHTNHPDRVLRAAERLGKLEERKVDDMLRQAEQRGGGQRPLVPLHQQPDTVAVVCDSTADLPAGVRLDHGIEMAPLQVLFGDQVFRDQVDLSTAEFYEKLKTDPHHPSTSQPPPRAFVEALDRVREDRDVVVITVSTALSGTARSARSALALVPHPRVEIFDSDSASTGLGLLVLNAARYAATGASIDRILEWLARWRDDTGLLFSLETLEFLRRGGRIGAARSFVGELLGLRPVLTFREGEVVPLATARGREDAFRQCVQELDRRLAPGTPVRLGLIGIGDDRGQLDRIEEHLRDRLEVVELLRGAPTGVVGAHAGPGAWGVFHQRVRADDPLLR